MALMTIAIHHDPEMRDDSYAHRWTDLLEEQGHKVVKLNFKTPDVINQIRCHRCQGAMWHWTHTADDKQMAPKILPAIEKYLGIPTFPNLDTSWYYDEKISQHYIFDALNAPKIKSWVFWNLDAALDFLSGTSYPLVFKLSVGAGAANVVKIDQEQDGVKLARKMFKKGMFPYTINEFANNNFSSTVRRFLSRLRYIFASDFPLPKYFLAQKNYFYIQEFVPNNSHDIRITVIGNRAFGYIRHNRPGDFRASGSGNFDTNPALIPREAVEIAHRVSKQLCSQSMAYDFLINGKGDVLLNEISYCYVNWMVHKCPGHWDDQLSWCEGKLWPEQAHIEDFLTVLDRLR